MERGNRRSRKGKKAPRVPIRTYRWEDLHRAKRKGGYPWTYLYKSPFNEVLDPQPFTMDALRRSKSSCTMGKSEHSVEIKEIGTESRKNSFNPMVTEPEDPIAGKEAPSSSVLIIECPAEVDGKQEGLESAESSDNISQYLDKEERNLEELKITEEPREARAKSEEKHNRKRKHSAESSYSRISLSKLVVMKKLRDAKKKLKVPKISFPGGKFTKPAISKKQSPPTAKKEVGKPSKSLVSDKPVYIHIPLKPPPGQDDEFSYLEFEEKKPEEEKTSNLEIREMNPEEEKTSNVEIVEDNKPEGEKTSNLEIGEKKPEEEKTSNVEIVEKKPEEAKTSNPEIVLKKPEEKKRDIKINPAFKGLLKSVRELGEKEKAKDEAKIQSSEPTNEVEQTEKKDESEIVEKMEIEETKESSKKDAVEAMEQLKESYDAKRKDITESIAPTNIPEDTKPADEKASESTEEEDVFDRFFKKPQHEQPPELAATVRQQRSKSAEPERKRKGSLESSYSRKSLSKLAFIKRLKEASDRVISTLTRSHSSKQLEKPKKPEKKLKEFVGAPVQKKQLKDGKPVYIHIPLKPPEGQTDEFSHLEHEGKLPAIKDEAAESSPEIQTPTKAHDIQLIFLTPPSDDEILDDKPDIPDTPSSETKFFGGKIDELKALAQLVVDEVSPESKKNTLEPVTEESPHGSKEELKEKMMVDEEDGLNEAPKVEKPVKKKVSFRRRSKPPKDDGEYEPIEAPKEEKRKQDKDKPKLQAMAASMSMSTDEEKTYLDQKIMKETSLEEDYNKWSKLSDQDNHEYEPINPPQEVTFAVAPTVTVIDTEKFKDFLEAEGSNRVLPSTSELENSELKIEKRIERAEARTSAQSSTVSDSSKKSESGQEKALMEEEQAATKVSESSTGKFQAALKQKTNQLKSKLHNIKKPHINLPRRPSFQKPHIRKPDFKKFKFEKPNIHLPKIPDTAKINLPTFTLPKRTTKTSKRVQKRSYSTESNAGDSNESKKPIFDFSTYPRLFQKKSKAQKNAEDIPSYVTTPRDKKKEEKNKDKFGGSDTIRIPLHSEQSLEEELDLEEQQVEEDKEREDSVERRMQEAARIRYDDDIDTDDAYKRENDEINKVEAQKRWQRGSFKSKEEQFKSGRQITDLDSPEDVPVLSSDRSEEPNDIPVFKASVDNIRNRYSSDELAPKPGVMEEIGSDEFVIRQKGISQENIEYRKYLTSEIREAFRTPTSAAQTYRDYPSGSIQSLPETPSKKKTVKKPKRKKTPHHSQEQLPYDEGSVEEFTALPPSRPKRRSKRVRKPKEEAVVPYQQTIHPEDERLKLARESLGILGDDEREEIEMLYQNEKMKEKERQDVEVTGYPPEAPPRKHRSLKSLNFSENDSILGFATDRDFPDTSVPRRPERPRSRTASLGSKFELNETPKKPMRMRSRSSAGSGPSLTSSRVDFSEAPKRPSRSNSRTNSASIRDEDIGGYFEQRPCVEEPCVQDIRDYMGYAVVDKSKPAREPPLPPPRTPPRRRRSFKSTTPSDIKFSTVPRSSGGAPVRPLRNYSTLAQISKAREEPTYENKENIDIAQYIEIEDANKDLQSGDVVQKMRERPLPAPPRPPRKSKVRRSLQDITSRENIDDNAAGCSTEKERSFEEEVSTQTEPLPDDFVCEELVQEPTDIVLTPRTKRSAVLQDDEQPSVVHVERHLITPTHYTHEETVTHASLLVEPLEGSKILPESQLTKSNERIIPISREESDEDTSVIPEDFKKLKNPPQEIKTQKLQVGDLDVDKLTVNQLLAGKIVVSEIESSHITTGEISSSSGPLRIGDIQIPQSLVQEIIRSIASEVRAREDEDPGQKKTPMRLLSEASSTQEEPKPPEPPPRSYVAKIEQEAVEESPIVSTSPTEVASEEGESEGGEGPRRPPRLTRREEERIGEGEERTVRAEEPQDPEEPPPRPPQPGDYAPSQPPASFYALQAQRYVDGVAVAPSAPRRRRRARRSRSSSPTSSVTSSRVRGRRLSEPSLPRLAGQLAAACGRRAGASLRRLIKHVVENVAADGDGRQDAHVFVVILLVLVAGLILLGYGEEKTVVHLHHWEYFEPPRDA